MTSSPPDEPFVWNVAGLLHGQTGDHRDYDVAGASIDLPDDPVDLPFVAGSLVQAAVRNRGEHAFVVSYSDDPVLAEDAAGLLADELEAAGMHVVSVLRADDEVAELRAVGLDDPEPGADVRRDRAGGAEIARQPVRVHREHAAEYAVRQPRARTRQHALAIARPLEQYGLGTRGGGEDRRHRSGGPGPDDGDAAAWHRRNVLFSSTQTEASACFPSASLASWPLSC